jgi:DNA-binding transcriptional regulator PaaX
LIRARKYLEDGAGFGLCGRLIGSIRGTEVSTLYDLDLLDREARRLARWIRNRRIAAASPAGAFAQRLKVGGKVARLVGHDPRLPMSLWRGRSGMRELVRAFRAFEARITPRAQRFLDDVVGLKSTG